MSENQNGATGKAAARKKGSRALKFLTGKTFSVHDGMNAGRFAVADCLEGVHGRGEAQLVLSNNREVIRAIQTAGRLTEPCAQGLRDLTVADTDQPDSENTTVSEELAAIEAQEQALTQRKAALMAGKS